jgi:tetratricopeptide (TPR) repeat protein
MSQPINRAIHLYQISRYADAELELRRALAEQPHDPHAHALLGLCLVRQEKLQEAQYEAQQAIVLAPDWDFVHYCRAIILQERRRYEEAEASAREALRLDPASPRNYAQLASILYNQQKWQAALNAAVEGLQYDAEDAECTTWRTASLTKLGRQREAINTVDEALARNPDDSYAHANKAWALLHEGKPRPALEHFREALRLDPTNEYARHGMVEALKARNPIYRWMLAYFLWMARLDNRARWGVILGGYFGARILGSISRHSPGLAPWILPIQILYLIFVFMTWFAMPIFNLLLRLNRFGRHALSRDQRVASNWFGGCVALSIGSFIAWLLYGHEALLLGAVLPMGVAMPIVTLFSCDRGWPRQAMSLFAAAMALVGVVCLYGVSQQQEWGYNAGTLFLFGFIASPWVANALATVTVRR